VDGWRGAGAAQQAERWWETSPSFAGTNRNKLGITLDLRQPRGVELLKRLVAIGDVVVENYTPRVMGNFGLAYEQLREIQPRIIMASLPAYGSTGPWSDYSGFAFPVEEMAGFPQLTGYAGDGVPRRWGNAAADAIAGLHGAYAILAALEHRRRTGEGQQFDLSQVETLTSFHGEPILDYQVSSRLPRLRGNRHDVYAPHGLYPCRAGNGAEPHAASAVDGPWVAISVTNERQWRSLCQCIGESGWLEDGRFSDPASRHRHQDALDEGIARWTSARDRLDVMRALQAAGVPAMPVMSSEDLLDDEHLRARGYFQSTSRPEIGSHTHGLLWAHFSRSPIELKHPAPTLGQHNADVFAGLLGLSHAEIDDLLSQQVAGQTPVAKSRL
jgi:crotonobetainyl-CoA:carnitine CoA-transferase CaiB-like acyl-CoA transferase